MNPNGTRAATCEILRMMDEGGLTADAVARAALSFLSEGVQFDYFVNLDERGQFYADVRNDYGNTVFAIRSEDDGNVGTVEDGFMKHTRDLDGLRDYLIFLGIMTEDDTLVMGN